MLIIVEGSSEAGKTTLCHNLEDSSRILHEGKYDCLACGSGLQESRKGIWRLGFLITIMELAEKMSFTDIMVDRFHLSELYFSGRYRQGEFTDEDFDAVDTALATLSCGVLLCFLEHPRIPSRELDADEDEALFKSWRRSRCLKVCGTAEQLTQHITQER